jgi:hypothetical protein
MKGRSCDLIEILYWHLPGQSEKTTTIVIQDKWHPAEIGIEHVLSISL